MPIYRSKYDPYDVDRRQSYKDFDSGNVRVRFWRNETWRGLVWKFDVVGFIERDNTDEIYRGMPLEDLPDAISAIQKAIAWEIARRNRPPRKKPSDLDIAFMNKSNRKR